LANLHAEIYYPPYLYDASGAFRPRPVISSAPETIDLGVDFSVVSNSTNIRRVTLVKTGSVTHSVNMDQRFVELSFTSSSGTLFVHKASHHFDLLNWWLDSDPEEVFALAALEYYGRNNSFRHTQCRGCPHATQCRHYWDITTDPRLVRLYVDAERHDGYIRDGCVWDERIDIFDKMAAAIRYANGVQVSYSCTTYSPYEGYRIAFNGTKGRLEAWIHERQPWPMDDYDELRVTDNFGQSELIRIPHGEGGHGGGDTLLLDRVFKDPRGPDPDGLAAGVRDGAMAVLIGFAARRSADERRPVKVAELTSLQPQAIRPKHT
jgi:predicted dehydrogenase